MHARLGNTQSKPDFIVTTCKPVGTGLRSPALQNTTLTVTNHNNLVINFKHNLSVENYFDVPKILGGHEPGVKIIGGSIHSSGPVSLLCLRPR